MKQILPHAFKNLYSEIYALICSEFCQIWMILVLVGGLILEREIPFPAYKIYICFPGKVSKLRLVRR